MKWPGILKLLPKFIYLFFIYHYYYLLFIIIHFLNKVCIIIIIIIIIFLMLFFLRYIFEYPSAHLLLFSISSSVSGSVSVVVPVSSSYSVPLSPSYSVSGHSSSWSLCGPSKSSLKVVSLTAICCSTTFPN